MPVAQAAAAAPSGRSFNGVAAVGALFTEADGKLSAHFCTASVVNSAAGDLALTAAHCVYGRPGAMAFVPELHCKGKTRTASWPVTKVYTDSACRTLLQDPDHDVAVHQTGGRAGRGAGRERHRRRDPRHWRRRGWTRLRPGHRPTPDDADQPVWCAGAAKGFSASQLEFDCGGYPDGTSGGPFLADVNRSTGQGTVIGVIGGYQQGGDTSQVSYAASFGTAVAVLYAQAQTGG